MRTWGIWLRRGVGVPTALVVFGFVLTSLLVQPDWRVELDWATRLTAASLLLVCPGVAAATAFDVSRRLRPTVAMLSLGSTRPWVHIALPALAVVAWSVLAYVLVWAVAAVMVFTHDGVGITDWWVFPEILFPVFSAGMVGLLVGMAVSGRWAAPLAAVAVLAAAVVDSPWGRGPFEAVTTYGTLTGLQRPTGRALAAVVGVLVVGLGALVAARELHRSGRTRRAVVIGCAVVIVVGTVVPAAWPWRQEVYVVTQEPYGCVGSDPAVCGPRSRLKLLRPVQTSLADAYRALAGTDFTGPPSFRVVRVEHHSDLNGAAPLDFDPAFIRGDRYDPGAIARILARPHTCRALYEAASAAPILDAEDQVVPWLQAVLSGKAPARPVPDQVASSFKVIQACDPMTGDLH